MSLLLLLVLFSFTSIYCFGFITHSGDIYITTTNGTGGTGNTTEEIQTAVNLSIYYQLYIDWSHILNIPAGFLDEIDNTTVGGSGFNTTDASLNNTGAVLGVNRSYIQQRVTGTCGADQSIDEIHENGTVSCESDSDTTYNSDEDYIYETADVFYFNESRMNDTIIIITDARDTDTWNTTTEMQDACILLNSSWNYTTDTDTTYTADEDWINLVGTQFNFNETNLATIYYSPTSASVVAGSIDGGSLANVSHEDGNYDSVTFNFSEAAGSPGIDLRINFTGVSDFNGGVIRYKTSSLAGDYPIIQLWNYDDGAWEDYPALGESESFATIEQSVFDSTDHLSGGIVQMRIYKASNGNTNHEYYVDWVAIFKGYSTPAGEEIDPYAIHKSGDTMNGTLNMGRNSLTDVGELIMTGLSTMYNVTPTTDSLYSLGNSSLWWDEIWVDNVYAKNINASEITSTDMNTDTMDAENNITIGGYTVKKNGDDLVMVLV